MAHPGDPSRNRSPAKGLPNQPGQGSSFHGGIALLFVLLLGAAWAYGQGSPAGQSTAQLEAYPNLGWWEIFIVIALMAGNAIVSSVEASLEVLKPFHAKALRDTDQEVAAGQLQHLLDHRLRYIAATAFGNQACRFLLFLVSVTLAPPLAAEFRVRWGSIAALIVATLIVLIPILLVNMIVELVSQSYGALHAHRVALRYYRPIRVSAVVFALPTAIVTGLGNLIAKRFGGTASFTIANQAEEEIKTIVETAEGTGEIESDEKQLLHSVFEFTDTVVREVMTPRVDLDAQPVDADPAKVIELIKESGHSRIPLYEGTDDAIVGIIHAKDLLIAKQSGKPISLRELMRPAIVVPENKNLHDLLREMRHSRSQMAVVQDEFGGTSGIATIEDIVEELVGEIVDEYDEEEPEIVPEGDGFLVEGKTHLDDVNGAIGADLESDEFDTIGGYVFGLFGRQPTQGDSIDEDGYRFAVAETDGRRIIKLRVERVGAGEASSDAS
jgi:putative hemolysin